MTKEVTQQLKNIGLHPDDIVMVHASMRAAKINTNTLINALLEFNRTVMMYVGCGSPYDDIGRGKYTAEQEHEILETCPAFDFEKNPAEPDHGILAEKFRQFKGTICSRHVGWRMAANGPRSYDLIDNHPLQFGADAGSPLAKLVENKGKVVLIGSDLDQVTLLHHAEGITNIPDKKLAHIKVPSIVNGAREWIDITEHDSSTGICDWPERYFEKIIKDFIKENNLPVMKIGQADSYLLDAQQLIKFAVPYMESTARNLNFN